MFYVQHLLGIGHLVRCHRIARALDASGFATTIVSGGLPVGTLDAGGADKIQLPPLKAGPGGFATLVHPDGTSFTDADKAARRDTLLAHFDRLRPDILVTEAFPFGRRPLRFELLPLLERAASRPDRPLIAASIRDILQRNQKPGRDVETVDLVAQFFDLVLVHGDPAIARLEESFPLAAAFADKIAYTGLVAPDPQPAPAERHAVIVSAGGGAVGFKLLAAALAARPLSALRDASWLVVTGPNMPAGNRAALERLAGPGVTLAGFVPDLAARFGAARLSISQAGYNTTADLLVAGCPAVLVPFAEDGETEQNQRAMMMAERRLAVSLPEAVPAPAAMAAAIDQALALPPRDARLALDGAATTARLLMERLGAQHHAEAQPIGIETA
jgi:predicted glycosyltransferase